MIVGLVLVLAAVALWVPGDPPWIAAAVERIGRTGWAAVVVLCASLAVSPLGRALGRRGRAQASLRRRLGLAAAALVGVHLGVVLRAGWFEAPSALLTEPHLRSGATAAGILGLLALTSWPSLVHRLRLGHWKPLHRAVYAAALLVLHHVALSSHADPRHVLGLAVVVAVLLAARPLGAAWAALRARVRPRIE